MCTVIVAGLSAALLAAPPFGPYPANGEFEQVERGAFVRWRASAREATVEPQRVRGKWYHFVCDVKTGRFDRIHLYISMAEGTGTTWWDNFTSDKLPIVNPSFEQVAADGALIGWRQDNAGETIFSDGQRVTHGKHSLRITHRDPDRPLSRVWQVIEVRKNTNYRFEFDVFLSDDCTARPNIATLTYERDGKYVGSPMWIRTPSWSDIQTERTGHGEYVAMMNLAGGRAELSQSLTFPVNQNAEACVAVKSKDLQGELRLIVEDRETGARLGEAVETAKQADWHEIRVRFTSGASSALRLRLIGRGQGSVALDHARVIVGRELVPPVQHVNWLPADENYVLPEKLTIQVDGTTGKPFSGAMAILKKDLGELGVSSEMVVSPPANLQIRIGAGRGVQGKGPESYRLVVNPEKIRIAAESDLGVLRAVATLVQLFQQFDNESRPVALACEVSDFPDMPVRGAFWSPGFQFEQFARYKFNAMYYSTSYWLDWIHQPEQVARLESVFDQADKYGLEIYASTGVFQGDYVYRFHDPDLTEGKWAGGEKLHLSGTGPVALKHPLVIRTAHRGLTIRSADKRTIYREGKDYTVRRGTPLSYPFTKLIDAEPDAVARTADGAIPNGAEVLAYYNYAEPTAKSELCLTEPEATRIVADALAATFRKFPRLGHFNLNLDEIAYFKSCGRCRADKRKPEDLLGDWIKAINNAVHRVRPRARLVTWDDMLVPAGRARRMGFRDFSKVMPKDVIALSWGYTSVFPEKQGWPTVKFWSKAGVSTIVIPWYDPSNIRGWAQVVGEARRRGWPCLGMIDSYWHNRADYRETAMCTWRIPQKGQHRWVPFDFSR